MIIQHIIIKYVQKQKKGSKCEVGNIKTIQNIIGGVEILQIGDYIRMTQHQHHM